MFLRLAPSPSIAAMAESATPASAPRQPAWAAPITRASASAKRIGPQSAAPTPSATPVRLVTTASALGPLPGSHTVSTTTVSVPCT